MAAFLALLFGVKLAHGQAAALGDERAQVLITRAAAEYSGEKYEEAIKTLTEVLEVESGQKTALFLRALAYGGLGVRAEREKNRAESAKRQAGDSNDSAALAQAAEQSVVAGEKARAAYLAMHEDLGAVLRTIDDQVAVAQLLDAVALIKLSAGDKARLQMLRQAGSTLDRYLHPSPVSGLSPPEGLNRVRAEFFLAVVQYRLALRPGPEEDELVDPAKLEEARSLMERSREQAHIEGLLPETMPRRDAEVQRWLSYPNLYLGLIYTRQANRESFLGRQGSARGFFGEAKDRLAAAKQLDTYGDPPISLSGGLIPEIADKMGPGIDEQLARMEVARSPRDLQLFWRSGFEYDTNVTLLGDNTQPAPDIGRKRDVAVGTGFGMNYRFNLGQVSPGLERWTAYIGARSSANWHGDIDQYNEQDYGGSAALEYRLLDYDASTNAGPLYAGVYYDYDYFMLGNKGFVGINAVGPRLTLYTHDTRGVTTLGFRYEDRDYFERLYDLRFDRDGNYFGFNLGHSHELIDMTDVYGKANWGLAGDPQPGTWEYRLHQYVRPYIGIDYGWDSTQGREFDDDHFAFSAGTGVPLPYGLMLDLRGDWEWQDYKGGSLVDYHRRGRRDFIQRYGVGLERRFVLAPGTPTERDTITPDRIILVLRGDVRFTEDDSNVKDRFGQNVFSYDRAIYALSVALHFN